MLSILGYFATKSQARVEGIAPNLAYNRLAGAVLPSKTISRRQGFRLLSKATARKPAKLGAPPTWHLFIQSAFRDAPATTLPPSGGQMPTPPSDTSRNCGSPF